LASILIGIYAFMKLKAAGYDRELYPVITDETDEDTLIGPAGLEYTQADNTGGCVYEQ